MELNGPIRVVAVCVIEKDDRIFLVEGHDPSRQGPYYRPLGGRVGINEPEQEAVRREFRERIGAELRNLESYGQMENLSPLDGRPRHEIIILFKGDFVDPRFYEVKDFPVLENGKPVDKAVWKPVADLRDGKAPVYPDGLLELLGL